MPQEHQVLRCFSCEVFQVHIVKKAKKWECKMCGEKQSFKRNFGKGSGKDCRTQVMKLNELRMMKNNDSKLLEDEGNEESFSYEPEEERFASKPQDEDCKENKTFKSKWSEYLEVSQDTESEIEDDYEIIEKKKRKMCKPYENLNNKKICKEVKTKETYPVYYETKETYTVSNETKDLFEVFSEDESFKNIEKTVPKTNQPIKAVKSSKYAKYLDEDEDVGNEETKKVNTNLFDSDPAAKSSKYAKYLDKDNDVGNEEIKKVNTNIFDSDPAVKSSKYAKYLDEDDDVGNEEIKKVNTNIFDSDPAVKSSKYAKYLDEDDDVENEIKKVKNIFDSDPAELDDILNL